MRSFIKKILPNSFTKFFLGAEKYSKRMLLWREIVFSVSGVSPSDSRALKPSILNSPWESMKDLEIWKNPILSSDAILRIKNCGIFFIRGKSDDLYHVLPSTHEELTKTIDELLHVGEVAIDAGVNIGAITVHMAKRVLDSGKVLAIEMIPETSEQLKKNLELNELEWVEVVKLALSNKGGQTIEAEVVEGYFGQASIVSNNAVGIKSTVEVLTTTFDDLTKDIEKISIIKMDLEGAEKNALEGASETLEKTKAILFESWESDGGVVAQMLRSKGFSISDIDGLNFLAKNKNFIDA